MLRPAVRLAASTAVLASSGAVWGQDPLVEHMRQHHRGCAEVAEERVEAAKGLHAAAKRHFELGAYAIALQRWTEAYAFDCSAHRLLLNIASTHQRLGDERKAWEARALYLERAGADADPVVAARVARERPASAHRPRVVTSEAALDFALWPTRSIGVVTAFELRGQLEVAPNLLLALELPWAVWSDGTAVPDPGGTSLDGTRAGMGNPHLSAFYTSRWFSGGVAVGGRLGAPLASIADVDAQSSVALGGDAFGWTDLRSWAPGRFPISLSAGLDQRVAGPFAILADATASAFIPLGRPTGRFSDERFDFAVGGSFGFDLALPVHEGGTFGGGAAATATYVPTFEGDDFQATVRLFLAYRSDLLFVEAGTWWGLDAPLGWAFEDGRLLTLALSLGVPLPSLLPPPDPLAAGE